MFFCFYYAHGIIFQNVNISQANPILERIIMYLKFEFDFIGDVSVLQCRVDIKSVKHLV